MKVLINEIPLEGLKRDGELDPVVLNLNTDDLTFISPVLASCFITKTKDDLFVDCKLKMKAKGRCNLCLTDFDIESEKDMQLHYELDGRMAIKFDDQIRDEILMDSPIKVLCKEECKGLCSGCGKNLNDEPCECSRQGEDKE